MPSPSTSSSGYYEVAYTWAKDTEGRNAIRKSGATLPSGAALTYDYVSTGGRHDDQSSRVTRILHGATNVVQYAYNGQAQLVGTDYRQPAIMWLLYGSSAGSYPDLDNFNRVTSSRWTTDLTTDKDFFDVDITYDRNSNITRVEDNVHVGFDWSYTMDGLDRLSRGERGTWSGSITTQKEDQTWTLDQVGNWDQVSLDFDADNVYTGSGEYNDDRTHNAVNELIARDTDDNGSDNYTLTYDAVGNLTDDPESYEYVYDPFGRLRKVNTQASALVAEYKYNGLGYMIAVHEDTDTDADVDSNDKWFYPAYDERWRMVANFRESDTSPKEEWVNQEAGLDGLGSSSYINGVVMRNRDANTAWTSAADGNLEERIYFCQNWRGDVSALVYANGDQAEQVRYSPYGTPFGFPGGDTESDCDCDATDVTQIQTWINAPSYDVRADIELDGDVDATDKSVVQAAYQGLILGRGALSAFGSDLGWAGYSKAVATDWYQARSRNISVLLGRWDARDALAYTEGVNTYEYSSSRPIAAVDPMGLVGEMIPWLPAPGGSQKQREIGYEICAAACAAPPFKLGGTTCNGTQPIICICVNNIKQKLGPSASQDAIKATVAATLAHETSHWKGSTCLPGGGITSTCSHPSPCSWDAELAEWKKQYAGPCDTNCQKETKDVKCEACKGGPLPGDQPSTPLPSICTGC